MTMAERIEDDKIENDKERQTEEMAVDGVCKEEGDGERRMP